MLLTAGKQVLAPEQYIRRSIKHLLKYTTVWRGLPITRKYLLYFRLLIAYLWQLLVYFIALSHPTSQSIRKMRIDEEFGLSSFGRVIRGASVLLPLHFSRWLSLLAVLLHGALLPLPRFKLPHAMLVVLIQKSLKRD